MDSKLKKENHNIEPVYDSNSKILILGSFPSVKSREKNFFYGHPQNRFWKVLSSVFGESIPTTIEEKKVMLIKNKIAVWDVIDSCEIEGSSDSSIKNVVPTDLDLIFDKANIEKVFLNGNKAYDLYMKYSAKKYNKDITKLPSTSPANARFTLDKLIEKWKVIAQ